MASSSSNVNSQQDDEERREQAVVARRRSGGSEEAAGARRRSAGGAEEAAKLERAASAQARRRGRLAVVRSLESHLGSSAAPNQAPISSRPQLFSLKQLALNSRGLAKKRSSVQEPAAATTANQPARASGAFARLLELAQQDSQSSSASSADNSWADERRREQLAQQRSSDGSERGAGSGQAGGSDSGEPDVDGCGYGEDEDDEDEDEEEDEEEDYEDTDDDQDDDSELEEELEWRENGENELEVSKRERQDRRRRRRRRRSERRSSSTGCHCQPMAAAIGSDGLPVSDVDLASYKDLCQLAQAARHLRPGQQQRRHLEAQALGSGRRSSLQEESGAYYQLCTSPEEQAIRARFLWFPPALRRLHQVELFFAGFPPHKVPTTTSSAEAKPGAHRDEQISFQLPCQDMALDDGSYPLDEAARRQFAQFVERRNCGALDVASVAEVAPAFGQHQHQLQPAAAPRPGQLERVAQQRCRRCLVRLEPGQLAVVAPNFVIGSAPYPRSPAAATEPADELEKAAEPRPAHHAALFHPTCFTCSTCKEFLVDLVYCLRDNKLYCVRHYGETLRPRCSWCQELIFSDEYLKAMNESFHVDHFLCRHCDSNLAGQRYVLKDDKPFCVRCYESNFANLCESCHKSIGIDSRDLAYKEKHWHDACFVCNKCQQPLIDKPFGSKADKVYCAHCYELTFATRCDGCKNPFRSGSKKMEYKGRQWHDSCFCCCVCLNTIGSNSFIPKNEEIYCIKCYENKYATKCTKCKQVIVSGGVTFRNEPWHRDCFNCCNCNKSLAGQRFTTRDVASETVKNTNRTNQPHNAYCIDCYGELFAKKCYACSQAITGLGGTRFVTFEDRSWHNACFICNDCQVSLVGKGFITDGPDSIVCGDCARAKLR